MTENQRIAELIFGQLENTADDYEKEYPPLQLGEGQRVTRIAPSPTGYLHLGVLFSVLYFQASLHLCHKPIYFLYFLT